MKQFNLAIYLCVFLFASCSGGFEKIPTVEKGVLDLTGWDPDKKGNLSLNGDWEFYWNRLYLPADFNKDTQPQLTCYSNVPSTWNGLIVNGENLPGTGYATYRMKIKNMVSAEKLIALRMMDAGTAYKFFLNGELIASNGVVASDLDKMQEGFRPLMRVLNKAGSEHELIVQVSNKFHARGGLWSGIQLGTQDRLMKARDKSTIYDLFFIGATFILFIYHLWIFLFRKSEKAVFWFGLMCFFMMLRVLVTNERFIFDIIPSLSLDTVVRLEYLTIALGLLALSMVFYNLFIHEFSKKALNGIVAIVVLQTIMILSTDTVFFTGLLIWFQLFMVVTAAYVSFVMVLSVIRKRQASVSFLFSFVIIFLCMLNDVLYSRLIINTAYIFPLGFFIAILSQAYLLAYRISDAFNTIEKLSVSLEQKVEQRTFQLKEEKKKSDDLLHNILPEEVALELKKFGTTEARQYEDVTVMFTDFVNFTGISEKLSAGELVAEIDYCFKAFDEMMERNGLEKIKTIGDAYMAACGLPKVNDQHAVNAVKAAVEIRDFMKAHEGRGGKFKIRIGLSSGPVVAGIVGSKKFAYDIWGDTVNMASRMETSSEEGKINISETTYELVKGAFTFEHRGKVAAKNKGEVDMYFVV